MVKPELVCQPLYSKLHYPYNDLYLYHDMRKAGNTMLNIARSR